LPAAALMKTRRPLIVALATGTALTRDQFETRLVPTAEPLQAVRAMEATPYLNNPTPVAGNRRRRARRKAADEFFPHEDRHPGARHVGRERIRAASRSGCSLRPARVERQALPGSRSLNTVYFKPTVAWDLPRGWQLSLSPRFIGYVDKEENPDLERYRGYVEWLVTGEHRDGVKLSASLRKGTSSGFGSAELNASWPLDTFFPELGGRILLQYFNGWGESLLDYNLRRPDQFRVGFMVVP
jgi:hypothetical protein